MSKLHKFKIEEGKAVIDNDGDLVSITELKAMLYADRSSCESCIKQCDQRIEYARKQEENCDWDLKYKDNLEKRVEYINHILTALNHGEF